MVTPYYPPSVGGIERFVARLSENLKSRGIGVRVLTGTHFGRVAQGDGVVQIPTRLTIMGNPLIPGLVDAIGEEECDVVHAHDEHAFTSNTVAYARARNKRPFLLHCHGSYTGGSPLWRLFVYTYMKTLGSYTLTRSDLSVALSPSEAEILKRFGGRNIRIIPNAVDPSELHTKADPSLFRSRRQVGGRKLVLFVGRLIRVKGVHLLPRIASLFNSTSEDVCFAVVGDGPMREALKRSSKRMGLRNMIITGRVSQEELSSAYAAADVVLAPSQSEGMPAVVLEALIFRKPVVATRLPTLVDYFAQTCRFVEPGDIQGYARAVRETLKNPPPESALTEVERLVTARFNWARVTDEIVNAYRELTQREEVTRPQ
jgi:glycosyltransferase involved in cell wall biosynthesis